MYGLNKIWQRLLEITSWTTVRDTGVWLYQQNYRTGARRVRRAQPSGYQPVDQGWVKTGSWTQGGLLPNRVYFDGPLDQHDAMVSWCNANFGPKGQGWYLHVELLPTGDSRPCYHFANADDVARFRFQCARISRR
jgi:hypothetical protein